MTPADALGLFGHCLLLSLLAIGGAIAVAPDLHRYVVIERGWLGDAQFTDSIALAQAAPGPNLLFIAVVGWNAGGWMGTAAAMTGVLIPSTTVALAATRWGLRRDDHPAVVAFKAGMAPVTIGLVAASGWVLTEPFRAQPVAWGLIALSVWGSVTQRLSPMTLIAIGAIAGAAAGALPAASLR